MCIKEEISSFISILEVQVSVDMKKRDDSIEARFTTFGHRAGCKALYEVIELLDDDIKSKVVEMMKNRKVLSL